MSFEATKQESEQSTTSEQTKRRGQPKMYIDRVYDNAKFRAYYHDKIET